MSKIKVSPIEEVAEMATEVHEPDEAAGSIESPTRSISPAGKPVDIPAPKPKRIRKKPEPKEEIPPPPPEPTSETKKGKMITCATCGKELLEKTFKYYHQLKCKPKEYASQQQLVQPPIKTDSITVDFGFQRRAKLQERYTNLMARAF